MTMLASIGDKTGTRACTLGYSSCSTRSWARSIRPFISTPAQELRQQSSYSVQRSVLCQAGFGGFGGFGKKKKDAKPNGASNSKKCACDLGQDYVLCCGRYHGSKSAVPPTPEAALRARYSAYARRELKYIMDTTHPDNPARKGSTSTGPDGKLVNSTFEQDVRITADFLQFKGFRLLDCQITEDGQDARVTYEYDYTQARDIAYRRVLSEPGPLNTQRDIALFRLVPDKGWLHMGSAEDESREEQQQETADLADLVAQQ